MFAQGPLLERMIWSMSRNFSSGGNCLANLEIAFRNTLHFCHAISSVKECRDPFFIGFGC